MTAFSPQYVHGVYIPSALLLIGITIIQRAWLPYAIAFVAVVGGWKIYSGGRNLARCLYCQQAHIMQDLARC